MFAEFINMFLQVLQNPSLYTFNLKALELSYLSDYILQQALVNSYFAITLIGAFFFLLYLVNKRKHAETRNRQMITYLWMPLLILALYTLFCVSFPALATSSLYLSFMSMSVFLCFAKNALYLNNNRVIHKNTKISFLKEQNNFLHPSLYLNTFFVILDFLVIHFLYININNTGSTKLITDLLLMNQNHGWPYLTQSFYGSLLYVIFYGVYAQIVSCGNAIIMNFILHWVDYLKKTSYDFVPSPAKES